MRMSSADTGAHSAVPDDSAAETSRNIALTSPPSSQTTLALQDIIGGACAFRLWGMLGWQDIRLRYRRSTFGPFWLTVSMGALVGGLGVLYAGLFKVDVADYLPFIAAGFVLWGLLSDQINEGCTVFIDAEGIISR